MATRHLVPMPDALVYLLGAHPGGLRTAELRQALQPLPDRRTVHRALQVLCQRGLVVRVARGRYALTSALRTLTSVMEARM